MTTFSSLSKRNFILKSGFELEFEIELEAELEAELEFEIEPELELVPIVISTLRRNRI